MLNLSTSAFKVKNINVKVDSLKFSIHDSKHGTLYKTLRCLATDLIKCQIQKDVEDAITTMSMDNSSAFAVVCGPPLLQTSTAHGYSRPF